jgi:hypothetical protein
VQSLTMVQEEASSNVTREREHAPAPEQARTGDPAALQCDGEQRQAPDEPKRRRGHGTGSAAAPILAIGPKSISWRYIGHRFVLVYCT